MGITQYYSILYGHYNIAQYYMDITILVNITYNITQYTSQIICLSCCFVLFSINITQYYMRIGYYSIQCSSIFIVLCQYYSILHVILSYSHFNTLLHNGEYWFQYYLILPEQLADATAVSAHWLLHSRCVVGQPQIQLLCSCQCCLPEAPDPPAATAQRPPRARIHPAATAPQLWWQLCRIHCA